MPKAAAVDAAAAMASVDEDTHMEQDDLMGEDAEEEQKAVEQDAEQIEHEEEDDDIVEEAEEEEEGEDDGEVAAREEVDGVKQVDEQMQVQGNDRVVDDEQADEVANDSYVAGKADDLAVPTTAAQALGPPAPVSAAAVAEVCNNATEVCNNVAEVCNNATEVCNNAAEVCNNAAEVCNNVAKSSLTSLYAHLMPQASAARGCPVQGARELVERLKAGDVQAVVAAPRLGRTPVRPQTTYGALPPELLRYHERTNRAKARARNEALAAKTAAAREVHAKRQAAFQEQQAAKETEIQAAQEAEAKAVEEVQVDEHACAPAEESVPDAQMVAVDAAEAKQVLDATKRQRGKKAATVAPTEGRQIEAAAENESAPDADATSQEAGSKKRVVGKKRPAEDISKAAEIAVEESDKSQRNLDIAAKIAAKLGSKSTKAAVKESDAIGEQSKLANYKGKAGKDKETEKADAAAPPKKAKVAAAADEDKETEKADAAVAPKKAKIAAAADKAKPISKEAPKVKLSAEVKKFLGMNLTQRTKAMMKMNLTQQMKLAQAMSLAEGGG